MKVTLNGEELTLPTVGEQLIKRDQEGRILLIVQRFQDAVFVHLPQQMLKVLSNGSAIEVFAPQLLKSRAVGLCGDMNGERSADLKTPHMCVLRPRLAALSFMLNKSGDQADEYNKVHKWRSTHPLHHLADEESDISKWAF